MRILKKFVKKLYHLIWFLSVFFFFSPIVFATDGLINGSIYSSDISASAQAEWFDVNHNSITTSLVTDYGYSPYFKASSRYNSYLSFNVYLNFQTNAVYSLTIYLNTSNNTNLSDWNNNIATGTWNGGANNNNKNNTCRAYVYSNVSTYNIKYRININDSGTSEARTGAVYMTFTPSCSGSYINIPVAFDSPSGDMYFYGYHLEVLGLSDGLTRSDIQSVINSSGLATANSVSQVQQGVNEVKQELSNIDDTLNDDNVDGANSQVDDLLDNSNFDDSTGIQSIINAPLNFINSLSNTCSPINVTIPYINKPLQIPCIKQELNNHIPLIVPVLSTAINGFIIYRILLDLVRIIKNSRNPDDDRIEVLDL